MIKTDKGRLIALVLVLIVAGTFQLFGKVPANNYEFYGFVRNDFYYNSRMNEETTNGIFNLFPKPILNNLAGIDENAVPQAEMISVATRLGVNIQGESIAGAKTSAKIEVDFAGSGTMYFLARLRQSYLRLGWETTALTIGQTWHPMFSSVSPTGVSYNAGVPFQPFNRSPQLRIDQKLSPSLNLIGAALYQMQYTSNGPQGFSASYMKKAIQPDVFVGLELRNSSWISGMGLDYKKIQPNNNDYISSLSAIGYVQYRQSMWQIKAKGIYGQNLSDHLMPGGYGVKMAGNSAGNERYTNINTFSSWLNVVYGNTWQVGIFGGYLQNLGSGMKLHAEQVAGEITAKYTIYGRGFYSNSQEILDRLVRIAPMLIYNAPNFQLGIEYNLTMADYGKLQSNGRAAQPYTVDNHRVQISLVYHF